jgi:glutathione S-transferase
MTQLQPLKLYGKGGPNPPKVAIILEELSLPYEAIPIPFDQIKEPSYTSINPNGRLPSLHDPNTNLTIWESGAIVEYLIEKYDTAHKLSFNRGTDEYYHAMQWATFQATGQGPYYGQAAWFSGKVMSQPRIQGPFERYVAEVNRVTGVLEAWLAKRAEEGKGKDGPWLVGDRISYADLAWVQWQIVIGIMLEKEYYDISRYPMVEAWIGRMAGREKTAVALGRLEKH